MHEELKRTIRQRIRDADPYEHEVFHMMRSDGTPLRVAVYHRYKEDDLLWDCTDSFARHWIATIPNWQLIACYSDARPGWSGYAKMLDDSSSYDLIVVRNLRAFGRESEEALRRIADLKCPVFFNENKMLSTDPEFHHYMTMQRILTYSSGEHLLSLFPTDHGCEYDLLKASGGESG